MDSSLLKSQFLFVWVTFNLGSPEGEHPVQLVIICQSVSATDDLQTWLPPFHCDLLTLDFITEAITSRRLAVPSLEAFG